MVMRLVVIRHSFIFQYYKMDNIRHCIFSLKDNSIIIFIVREAFSTFFKI